MSGHSGVCPDKLSRHLQKVIVNTVLTHVQHDMTHVLTYVRTAWHDTSTDIIGFMFTQVLTQHGMNLEGICSYISTSEGGQSTEQLQFEYKHS